MDRLELVKENVQPLRQGRKIETLTAALDQSQDQQDQREETRKKFEEDIQQDDIDPEKLFEKYYGYINWLEQNYPNPPQRFGEILEQCIERFHKEKTYRNDERMLSIFLKYINTVKDQFSVFMTFYKAGFATKCAKFYTEWAFHWEMENNFKRAMKVIDAGIKNGAEPLVELKNAMNDLEVKKLRSVLAGQKQPEDDQESRKALNCLKASVKRDGRAMAPIDRVGGSAGNTGGGLTKIKPATDNNAVNGQKSGNDGDLKIFVDTDRQDEMKTDKTKDLIVRGNIKENAIETDKWVGRTLTDLKPERTQGEQFAIFVDGNQNTRPIVDQEVVESKCPVALFEDDDQMKKYCWYEKKDEIYRDGTEFSFEEIRAKRWRSKQSKINNNNNKENAENTPTAKTIPVALFEDDDQMKKYCWYGKKDEIYRDGTEYSFEEIHAKQWQAQMEAKMHSNDQSDQSMIDQTMPSTYGHQLVRELDSRMLTATVVGQIFFSSTLPPDQTYYDETEYQSKLDKSMFMVNDFDIMKDETETNSTPLLPNYNPNFANGLTSKLDTILEASHEDYSKSSSSSSSSGTITTIQTIGVKHHFETQKDINPFDRENYRKVMLAALADPVEFRKGYYKVPGGEIIPEFGSIPCQRISPSLMIVFKGFDLDSMDECQIKPISLRICRQADDYWEFYIYDDLQRRLVQHSSLVADVELSLMTLDRMVFYQDGYIAEHDLDMRDSLYDFWQNFRKNQKSFPSLIIAYVVLELMLIIQKLHQCKIIHSDINAKNLFLTQIEQDDLNSLGKRTSFVKLVNFSRSIDMVAFPNEFTFKRDYYPFSENDGIAHQLLQTSWNYEIDWFGFMDCIYQLACKDNMKIGKDENGKWILLGQRFPELPILNQIFDHLLNLSNNQSPILQPYIDHLAEYLEQRKLQLYSDIALMFYNKIATKSKFK